MRYKGLENDITYIKYLKVKDRIRQALDQESVDYNTLRYDILLLQAYQEILDKIQKY